MNPGQIFGWANYLAMVGWLLLIVLPKWRWTVYFTSTIIAVVLGALYVALFISSFGKTEGGFGSLIEVSKLFSNQQVLLAGWVHYLAFDLFIGSWQVTDARRNNIHHLIIIPSLVLTYFAGPVGLLLYLIIRTAVTKKLLVENFS